jgi:hypothetical protein
MKAKLICTAVLALASFSAAAQDPTSRCIAGLASEPRLQAIADKVALGQAGQPRLIRVAESTPAADERTALALWLNMRNECFDAGDQYRRSVSKAQDAAYLRSVFAFQQRLVAELRDGRLTYAEYQRRRAELTQATGQEI